MQYPDLLNPDLLDRIPLDARVVLDVGCGSGALGAEYKRRNPRARVLGIEQDEVAAKLAAARLDKVFQANLDNISESLRAELGDGSVDCLIYGDVLEHLHDPWAVLAQHSALLSESGLVLICMPNAEHWSFVERLLRGTWDYEEQGLFDKTHLRWFTAETLRRALHRAKLTPIDVSPRTFDLAASEAFASSIRPALHRLGIEQDDFVRRSAPLQHVWRATRRPPEQRLHIVSTMLNPVGGVSHLRVVEPMRALAASPRLETTIIGNGDSPPEIGDQPRIFIFHRPLLAGEQGLSRVRALVQQGWLVLCEFDDHPDYIPVLQRPDIQNFRAVHAVQTSTEPLANVLRRQNPEVAVFPNAIARLPEVRNFSNGDVTTVFFAGLNRENEWPPFLAALNNVARRAGARLHFQIVNDRGLFESLQTSHKTFTPLCDYETYQNLLSSSEVSFMPLIDTPFNRCKSDLKFIEAASHRAVALASRIVYQSSIEDGRTGILFQDTQELEARLEGLIASQGTAKHLGEAARQYVANNRMLAYQVARREEWYHQLWARRSELTQSLRERVPEFDKPSMTIVPDKHLVSE